MRILGISSELQKKNEQDFIDVTRRIQNALTLIENDDKLKATQSVLVHLADCSRGTLNNRKWPLERLKEIKLARKASKQHIAELLLKNSKVESKVDRYKQQLYDSRDELLIWKNRYDEINQLLTQANNLNRVLQIRLTAYEKKNSSSTNLIDGKVVTFNPKNSK